MLTRRLRTLAALDAARGSLRIAVLPSFSEHCDACCADFVRATPDLLMSRVGRPRYSKYRPASREHGLYPFVGPIPRPKAVIRRSQYIGVCFICAACLGGQDLRAQSIGLPSMWRPMQWFNTNSTPHPSVVRVFVPESHGMSVGSGTLVAVGQQHGLVLTNWHVVRDGKGEISVVFPDGFRSGATVLKVDQNWDLAALLIWRPHVTPVPIASTPPRPGDELTIAGYGHGSYRSVQAHCTQYVSPGDGFPYEMVEVSAEAREGDSGGPILNDRGELAGVLFGAGRGTTSGSQSNRVRWFLADVWPTSQDGRTHAHIASTPSLGEPDPYFRDSTPPVHAPQPFFAATKPRDRATEPFVRDSAPSAQDSIEPAADTQTQSIHRLPPTSADPLVASWARAPRPAADTVPAKEPRFVRISSDDASAKPQAVDDEREQPAALAPSPVSTPVDWDWILGQTAIEKAKTILATIGLLTIVIQLAKWSDRKEEQEEEES